MKLLYKFSNNPNTVDFGVREMFSAVAQKGKQLVGKAGKEVAEAVNPDALVSKLSQTDVLTPEELAALQQTVANAKNRINSSDVEALQYMAENAKKYKAGVWEKINAVGNAGMLASIPFMALPFMMKDANTAALENMRKEDKIREAVGLRPLTTTTQLAQTADSLQDAGTAARKVFSSPLTGVRVANPASGVYNPGRVVSFSRQDS